MAGTKIGGQKAKAKNIAREPDFYRRIGGIGGRNGSRGKGFASEEVGKDGLTGKERAMIAGKKGGEISRRSHAE